MEPQAAPHGGWVARVVEVDGVLRSSRGGKSGNRPSGLMPPACCICFGGHGVPLDNDQRGSWPIGSCWSRGVCPPELQAFLHPANKPPALPTPWDWRCSSPVFRSRRVTGPVSPSRSGMARAGPSRSIGPLPGGSMGFFTIIKNRFRSKLDDAHRRMGRKSSKLERNPKIKSNIDDRVPIPVMLGTARRPSVRPPGLGSGCLFLPQKGRHRGVANCSKHGGFLLLMVVESQGL